MSRKVFEFETKVPIFFTTLYITNDLNLLTEKVQSDVEGYDGGFESTGKCVSWSNGQTRKVGIFADDISTAVHESVHAAHEVFEHIGHKLDINNDEVHAYLIEWIFTQWKEQAGVKG